MHAKPKYLWKSKSMLVVLLLAIVWMLFPILVLVVSLINLIDHINIDTSTAILFSMLYLVSLLVLNAGPVCSFLMLFSEPCYHLNAWMKSLLQIVESKEQCNQKIVYECKNFFYKGKLLKIIRLTQSYQIKSPPWTILWFRILGIFSVENITRLCVFKFQT